MNAKQEKSVDIKLKFGDDYEEKKKQLLDISATFEGGKTSQELNNIMIKQKQSQQKDMFIMFKFYVTSGREKQAAQYLKRGMDETDPREIETLNPIQRMLKRPKSSGRVYMEQKQGMIVVYYCIYNEYVIRSKKNYQPLLSFFTSNRVTAKMSMIIKGEEAKGLKDKTQIDTNYSELNFEIQNLPIAKMIQVLDSTEDMLPEQLKQMSLFKLIRCGLRKIQVNSEFNIFRKFIEYYKDLKRTSKKTKQENEASVKMKRQLILQRQRQMQRIRMQQYDKMRDHRVEVSSDEDQERSHRAKPLILKSTILESNLQYGQLPPFSRPPIGPTLIKTPAQIDNQNQNKQANPYYEPEKPDAYLHKNILRNKIEFQVSWSMLGLLKGEVKFMIEDHLQRTLEYVTSSFQFVKDHSNF